MNSKVNSVVLYAICACLITSCAEFKDSGRAIGHAARDTTRVIGHAARDTTRAIGHGTRDVVKTIGGDTEKALNEKDKNSK